MGIKLMNTKYGREKLFYVEHLYSTRIRWRLYRNPGWSTQSIAQIVLFLRLKNTPRNQLNSIRERRLSEVFINGECQKPQQLDGSKIQKCHSRPIFTWVASSLMSQSIHPFALHAPSSAGVTLSASLVCRVAESFASAWFWRASSVHQFVIDQSINHWSTDNNDSTVLVQHRCHRLIVVVVVVDIVVAVGCRLLFCLHCVRCPPS